MLWHSCVWPWPRARPFDALPINPTAVIVDTAAACWLRHGFPRGLGHNRGSIPAVVRKRGPNADGSRIIFRPISGPGPPQAAMGRTATWQCRAAVTIKSDQKAARVTNSAVLGVQVTPIGLQTWPTLAYSHPTFSKGLKADRGHLDTQESARCDSNFYFYTNII